MIGRFQSLPLGGKLAVHVEREGKVVISVGVTRLYLEHLPVDFGGLSSLTSGQELIRLSSFGGELVFKQVGLFCLPDVLIDLGRLLGLIETFEGNGQLQARPFRGRIQLDRFLQMRHSLFGSPTAKDYQP